MQKLGNENICIMLRFRDIVTRPGGTIYEHKSVLQKYGRVWWGWWAKPYELRPTKTFRRVHELTHSLTKSVPGFLFDTGQNLVFRTTISDIAVAPNNTAIRCPRPEESPDYYYKGEYPAWLLLTSIENVEMSKLHLKLVACPTSKQKKIKGIGQEIKSLDDLRENDVTLWEVLEE